MNDNQDGLDGQERREYFRIKNWIIINHELIPSLEDAPPIEDLAQSSSPKINLLHELNRLENENQAYLGSLAEKQSQLGNYLLNINRKIELLTQFVVQSLDTDAQELTEVDISGGGVRFTAQDSYELDQHVKIELVLVPECVGIVAYGRVVDCKPREQDTGYDLALIFVKLREAHRDAIIKHVFQVQSRQLRQDQGENEEN